MWCWWRRSLVIAASTPPGGTACRPTRTGTRRSKRCWSRSEPAGWTGMPPRSLSDAEIEGLTGWPAEVAASDLVAFFTLGVDDLRWVRSHRGAANRIGLATQLCALGYLGFIP